MCFTAFQSLDYDIFLSLLNSHDNEIIKAHFMQQNLLYKSVRKVTLEGRLELATNKTIVINPHHNYSLHAHLVLPYV